MSQHVHDINLGESLGTLAWALAVAGKDRSEVDAAIAEGIRLTDQQAVTSSALMHLHSGYACAALGDSARAAEFWEAAATIDPQGRSGRAAQAASASQPQPAV